MSFRTLIESLPTTPFSPDGGAESHFHCQLEFKMFYVSYLKPTRGGFRQVRRPFKTEAGAEAFWRLSVDQGLDSSLEYP